MTESNKEMHKAWSIGGSSPSQVILAISLIYRIIKRILKHFCFALVTAHRSDSKEENEMLKSLTLLQSLYWQRESLHDNRWKLDRQIESQQKRGRRPNKLLSDRASIMEDIIAISTQMNAIENGGLVAA